MSERYRVLGLKTHRHLLIALLAYIGLTAIFFLPTLTGRRTFPAGDFTTLYLPYSTFFRTELFFRRLPIWNPYAYAGHPFLADPQSAVFYPINILVTLLSLPFADLAARLQWLEVEAICHFPLAGWFTYLLLWNQTRHRAAAFLAGAIFMFSGYLTGYPPLQLTILRTAVWLPLLLWALAKAIEKDEGRRWWVFSGVIAGVAFLAGHPQTFIYIAYAAVFWALGLAAGRIYGSNRRKRLAIDLSVRAGIAILTFLGVIAAQLLPSLEFVRLSVRTRMDYDFLSSGFTTQNFWQFIIPSVWSPFSPLYTGVIAVGLASVAGFSTISTGMLSGRSTSSEFATGNHRRLTFVTVFFALLAVLMLLVSMGRYGPLYPIFYHFAPGWKLFRNQERAAFLVTFAMSILAGVGMAWTSLLNHRQRKLWGWLAAGIMLAGLVAFFLVWQIPPRLALKNSWFTMTVLLSAASALLLGLLIGHVPAQAWMLAPLCILGLWHASWNKLQVPVDLQTAVATFALLEDVKTAAAYCDGDAPPCAVRHQGAPGRLHNETHLDSGFGPLFEMEEVWGASPLRLQRYARLFDEFPLDRMWQLTGVEHVLTWRGELFEPATHLGAYSRSKDETVHLYRLADPNPRAWFVSGIVAMTDDEAWKQIASYTVAPERQAIVAPEEAQKLSHLTAELAPGRIVQIQRLAPAHIRLTVAQETDGFLVLSENWMPGWQATLLQDARGNPRSEPLNLVRADLTFLGIQIPAGAGVIDVQYRPTSVRIGLTLSGLTWALLLLSLLYSLWTKRRP